MDLRSEPAVPGVTIAGPAALVAAGLEATEEGVVEAAEGACLVEPVAQSTGVAKAERLTQTLP